MSVSVDPGGGTSPPQPVLAGASGQLAPPYQVPRWAADTLEVVTSTGQRHKVLKCISPLCACYFDRNSTYQSREKVCHLFNVELAQTIYTRVNQLLNRPLAPAVHAQLRQRWSQIDRRQQALPVGWWALLERVMQAGDTSSAALYNRIQQHRRQGSKTLRYDQSGRYAFNWVRADWFVHGWAREGRPISLDSIHAVNRMLLDGLPQRHPAGTLVPDYEIMLEEGDPSRSYVPGSLRAQALRELVEWIGERESQLHPIELAAGTLQRMLSIHPYTDANGRTARLIINQILLKRGYPPVVLDPASVDVAVFGGRWLADNVEPEASLLTVTRGLEVTLATLERTRA